MAEADDLSFELARAVLAATEPSEVQLLDAMGAEFVQAAAAPTGGDGALGFDVAQLTMAVAASSIAVATKDYLVEVAKSYAVDKGTTRIKKVVAFLRRKRGAQPAAAAAGVGATPDPDPGPVLDEAEIREVHKRAFEHARGMGLSDSKAKLLADAMAGALSHTD